MFDSTLMMGGEMFPDEQSRRTALAPIVRYHFIPFAALVLHYASLLCIISSGILINVHTFKHHGFYFKDGAPRRAKIY